MRVTAPTLQEFWKEINDKGFLPTSQRIVLLLGRYPAMRTKVFHFNTGTGARGPVAYTAPDLFGTPNAEYFIVRNTPEAKARFAEFLAAKFKARNPVPTRTLKGCFSRMLHDAGLCWEGCYHNSI